MRCQPKIFSEPSGPGCLPAARLAGCRNASIAGSRKRGFTLIEVVMSIAIVCMVFGGMVIAYTNTGLRLEWTGYSLAAQSLALETIEQARASVWDPSQTPPVNEITNLTLFNTSISNGVFSGCSTNILDVPYESTNYIVATNYVTIQMININSNTNIQAEVLQVQTVWPFFMRKANLYFTNTVCTIIAPDNRDPNTF
jgi:prepilin-type N-terminal cleavage/methylation domain-containing protein